MADYRVSDLTTLAPESDIVAVVHYKAFDGYVELYKDGTVKLVSKAGTINTRFKELQKLDWIRQSYLQSLIDAGVTEQALERALEVTAQVECSLAEDSTADLEQRTAGHLRDWCAQRGLDYEGLSEDEFAKIVAEGLNQVRKKK
jgi:hypothetical protein